MAIMGLSCRNNQLFDEIRKIWVEATPEEVVRQRLLYQLVHHLKFPKEYIAIEKELKTLPHLAEVEVPNRRCDVICFSRGTLSPLLLIECKQHVLTDQARAQLLGYNHFVKAPFVALVNAQETLFGYETGEWRYLSFIPTYEALLRVVIK